MKCIAPIFLVNHEEITMDLKQQTAPLMRFFSLSFFLHNSDFSVEIINHKVATKK